MAEITEFTSLDGTLPARTLRATVQCEGIGLHTGRIVTLTVRPAPASTGILFRRMDLLTHKGPEDQQNDLSRISIQADPHAVNATTLGTVIANRHGVSVSTVEHLMFAFAATGIEHAIVEIDGPEVPIMDGSADPFIDLLDQSGVRDVSIPRTAMRLTKPLRIEKGDAYIEAVPLDDDAEHAEIDVTIEFDDASIGRQTVELEATESMLRSGLAGARTFCNLRDVEYMRSQGLALGGSMDNAIVVSDGEILNEGGLRIDSEFVRHKALDMIGDLYLLGAPLIAKITAFKPGHDLNTRFAKAVLDQGAATRVAVLDRTEKNARARA